jgi:predicted ATPase
LDESSEVIKNINPEEDELFSATLNCIRQSLDKNDAPRFTYIIGNNGTGKSKLLARIADYMAQDEKPPSIACISNSLYDRFTLRTSGPIQYLGARTSGNAVFHTAIDRLLCRMVLKAMTRKKSYLKNLQAIAGKLRFSVRGSVVKQADLSKVVDKRKLKNISISKVLSQSDKRQLVDLIGHEILFEKLNSDQVTALGKFLELNPEISVQVLMPSKQWVDFDQLSTGEQNRALIFAKVLCAAEEGCVILVDEPEISLHLHWQMEFHSSLSKLLTNIRRCHVIVATHSPTLISEAAKSDQTGAEGNVMVLGVTQHQAADVPASPCAIYSFAQIASHEQLILEYFKTAPYRTHAVDIAITEALLDAAEGKMKPNNASNKLAQLLSAEGLTPRDKGHINKALSLLSKNALQLSLEAK